MHRIAIVSFAVVSVLVPSTLSAQGPVGPPRSATRPAPAVSRIFSRVFVDVDGGYQSHTFSFSDTRKDPWLVETASWTADYGVKSGPTFGASGGVRVWRQLVARVGFSTFSNTNAASVVGSVPHPFFFNRDRSISGSENGLKQQENVIDAGAMWLIPVNRHVDVRVFGGPSFVQLKRDLLEDVHYRDSYPYDTAEFSGVVRKQINENAIGFHAGADVTYVIAGPLGIGGAVRFSQAKFTVTSPADGASLSIDTGGLQVGGGLRLRFGGGPAKVNAPDTIRRRSSSADTKRPSRSPSANDPSGDVADPLRVEPPLRALSPLEVGSVRLRTDSPVFVLPDAQRIPLAVLKAGTTVKVRDEQGDWLIVDFVDRRFGSRTGYVLRANCEW